MREEELFAAYGRPRPATLILPDERVTYRPGDVGAELVPKLPETRDAIASRFWACVVKLPGERSCWVWRGRRSRGGYGLFSVGNKLVQAHRFSYEMVNGELGPLLACHDCDNPPCVRPDHLWPGTHADNMRDMRQKGRGRKAGGARYMTLREREFRARRRDAIARSIPYVEPVHPQPVHMASERGEAAYPQPRDALMMTVDSVENDGEKDGSST